MSGAATAAAPARTRARRRLPPNLPLPSPHSPSPSPPRPAGKTRAVAALPKPPPVSGQPPPTAVPSLLPSGSSERRGRFPPAASHSLASRARCCRVPPCPSHGPSTGLGAAARDRVSSASRGRREAASCALRPLPLGCCRRRHLAASAWRGGGGGAPGLRAPTPPPAGHF